METNETQPIEQQPEVKPSTEFNPWGETSTSSAVKEEPSEPETPPAEPTEVKDPVQTSEKPEENIQEPTIKEVEKIVEKYPELSEQASAILKALQENNTDEIYNYLSEQRKDYNLMSDFDVVKENIRKNNPSWTDKDVDMEMKHKFGKILQPKDLSNLDPEIDPEEYEKALAFNEAIEEKELLLSREARDARIALTNAKQSVEFPKIEQNQPEAPKPLTQDEVDERNRLWGERVDTELASLSDFKFKVGDEEIIYKITDEDKKAQLDYMRSLNERSIAKDLGWIDDNGVENVLKIAEDMLFLKNRDKVVSSAATQMKTTATKEVVAEIKNLDLTPNPISTETESVPLGKLLYG